MSNLDREARCYDQQLPRMLEAHAGQYVIIKGDSPAHFSATYEEALDWGYDQFGLDDFFVKKVDRDADVAHFTRDQPCPAE